MLYNVYGDKTKEKVMVISKPEEWFIKSRFFARRWVWTVNQVKFMIKNYKVI